MAKVQRIIGGAHGALVTAVSPKVMEQAFGFLLARGIMALVGLPPDDISLPVFNTVLKRITVRGSIVGTRQDLEAICSAKRICASSHSTQYASSIPSVKLTSPIETECYTNSSKRASTYTIEP